MGTLKCQKLNKIWANKNKNLKQNKKSSKQLKIKSLKEFQEANEWSFAPKRSVCEYECECVLTQR
jgi:hypothetical protein